MFGPGFLRGADRQPTPLEPADGIRERAHQSAAAPAPAVECSLTRMERAGWNARLSDAIFPPAAALIASANLR
jgi:hypothetical protein